MSNILGYVKSWPMSAVMIAQSSGMSVSTVRKHLRFLRGSGAVFAAKQAGRLVYSTGRMKSDRKKTIKKKTPVIQVDLIHIDTDSRHFRGSLTALQYYMELTTREAKRIAWELMTDNKSYISSKDEYFYDEYRVELVR